MTQKWEDDVGSVAETVTLRCLARSLPASTWLKIVSQTSQGPQWDEGSRYHLAATLLSCLCQNQSAAPLVLQYIDMGLHHSNPIIFKTTTMCQALLDDDDSLQMAKEVLQDLCTILTSSASIAIDANDISFTMKRCTKTIMLLQIGRKMDSNSINQLTSTILKSFYSHLQKNPTIDDKERKHCLEALRSVSFSEEENGHLAGLLEKLQQLLMAKTERTGNESHTARRIEQSHEKWNEAEIQTKFIAMTGATSDKTISWKTDSEESTSTVGIQPEIANLLHFLIDEYHTWNEKLDATRMILLARLNHSEAKVDTVHQRFYLELFHGSASACTAIAGTPTSLGGDEDYTGIWRSALCGLLPSIVESLELQRVRDSPSKETSTREIMSKVVQNLFSDSTHAMTGCEVILSSNEERKKKKKDADSQEDEVDLMLDVFIGTDDDPARQPVRAAFLRSIEDKDLLHREDWSDLDGMKMVMEDWRLLGETFVGEVGTASIDASTSLSSSLESLFEQKFNSEAMEEADLWNRIVQDYACQQAFAQAVAKFVSDCITANDLENLAKLCKSLMSHPTTLNTIFLYLCPTQLLQPIANLMDDQDLLQNGEEPSVIGAILLFGQLIIQKCLNANYSLEAILPNEQCHFLASFVRSYPSVQTFAKLGSKEQEIISNWVAALFGSEGISDELIKSSSPQLLLRMTPTLFCQSITACYYGVIDLDTLRGGLTYFLQDLLSYTLPSALIWLLCDLDRCQEEERTTTTTSQSISSPSKTRRSKVKAIQLAVLCTLLSSETCPQIVQGLVANKASQVLSRCESEENSSTELKTLKSAVESWTEVKQTTKTHLWIKTVQSSINLSNLDSLLNLDASLSSVLSKRGVKGTLQIVFDTLALHPKSTSLSRVIAVSLSLATIQSKERRGLTDEVVIGFARQIMTSRNSNKSTIEALALTLQLLMPIASNVHEPNLQLQEVTDSIQAVIALRLHRLLKRVKSKSEIRLLARIYGVLFQILPRDSSLVNAFPVNVPLVKL